MRNGAHLLLPGAANSPPQAVAIDGPVPQDYDSCVAALMETRAALVDARHERDSLKEALSAIVAIASPLAA